MIAAVAAAAVALAAAQDTTPPPRLDEARIVPGRVVRAVRALSDSSQTYALYLPPDYDPTGAHPLLLVLDARGRALLPLQRLQNALAERSWIALSSYNSASDGDEAPNRAAMNAMLADAQAHLAVDTDRLYLAGFSGTARLAWAYGYQLAPHVAGVLGFGAGLPATYDLDRITAEMGAPFVFFGGAGEDDFNYDEMVLLEATLERLAFPHRIASYEGPHGWPPPDVLGAGIAWLDVQAMRRGLAEPDPAFLRDAYRRDLERAAALEERGRPGPAWHAYRQAVQDFDGLIDVSEARARTAFLESVPAVGSWRSARLTRAARYQQYGTAVAQWLGALRTADPLPSVADAALALDVDWLVRQSRGEVGTSDEDARAAGRRLALLYTQLSFYERRRYEEAGDLERLRLVLELAHRIRPDDPRVCAGLADAMEALGEPAADVARMRRCAPEPSGP
ncbi:MAG: hypothetical protein D6701_10650 [Gemmatimonadetes bacterium]|nr:MAG: hypothetical protein D6701_10650 [Gemmatimonadota bacterium]